jgi:hypothetical protein
MVLQIGDTEGVTKSHENVMLILFFLHGTHCRWDEGAVTTFHCRMEDSRKQSDSTASRIDGIVTRNLLD